MTSNVRILGGTTDNDTILLVDDADKLVGTAPKLDAHRRGLKHRAVSALVRNPQGKMLLHQRANGKYHSEGLWTNACCSHPRRDESNEDAVGRRLFEEMGVLCELKPLFIAHYRAPVSNELIENEVVHVFGGTYDVRVDGTVAPDPEEVSDWKWMPFDELLADQAAHPERYSIWFRHYLFHHGDAIARWMRS
jgi:isopentenyl-diphosphate Delta-isomerase